MPAREVEIELEAPVVAPSPPTETVGSHRLLCEVGSGGMASVYLALPRGGGVDDVVALKRVHPHLGSEREAVEMFLDEARIASLIAHPNVCPVLQHGMVNGAYYLTMPLLRGRPLKAVMGAMRRMPEEQRVVWPILAARLVADAAAGLHAAHELRDASGAPLHVVHRDVSPHNLFVTWDGELQVVDFGIAHARDRLHRTETGLVKGKFAYMAPEQMCGQEVDRRADVWSLGVVLFELLAGRALFRRKTQSETVRAVTSEEVPSLTSLAPEVPPQLEAIVERALARDPARRYPSADAMRRDLEGFLREQPGPTDASEVAAWMHELFPGGRAEDDARVERAVAHTFPEIGDVEERSGVRRRSDAPTAPGSRAMAITTFLLAALLAFAIGALVAVWPRLSSPSSDGVSVSQSRDG